MVLTKMITKFLNLAITSCIKHQESVVESKMQWLPCLSKCDRMLHSNKLKRDSSRTKFPIPLLSTMLPLLTSLMVVTREDSTQQIHWEKNSQEYKTKLFQLMVKDIIVIELISSAMIQLMTLLDSQLALSIRQIRQLSSVRRNLNLPLQSMLVREHSRLLR